MPSPNLTIIRDLYAAFAAGDVPAVLAAMSPDIVWHEADDFIYADTNPYVGPDAILNGVFARCGTEWDGFAVHIDELLDAGASGNTTAGAETVVALGHYSGTYLATGNPQHTQIAHVWRLKNGKVTAFQQHANTLHVARVAGTA